jgi:hypothetical protein
MVQLCAKYTPNSSSRLKVVVWCSDAKLEMGDMEEVEKVVDEWNEDFKRNNCLTPCI